MIDIFYYPLGSGRFVSQCVQLCIDHDPKPFELYDDTTVTWGEREIMHGDQPNKDVMLHKPYHYLFTDLAKKKKFIFVSIDSEQERDHCWKRLEYIDHMFMKDQRLRDVRWRFHVECNRYLKEHNVDYFDFPYKDIEDVANFCATLQRCCDYLGIIMDHEAVVQAHKKWTVSNIKHMQQAKETVK